MGAPPSSFLGKRSGDGGRRGRPALRPWSLLSDVVAQGRSNGSGPSSDRDQRVPVTGASAAVALQRSRRTRANHSEHETVFGEPSR